MSIAKDHASSEQVTHGRGNPRLTSCPVVTRLLEARRLLVLETRTAWSAYGIEESPRRGSPKWVEPDDLRSRLMNHTLDRVKMVWDAVNAACFVDGGVTFDGAGSIRPLDPESDSAHFLVLLDLSGFLLKFVKEQTIYASAVALGQTEMAVTALEKLLKQIEAVWGDPDLSRYLKVGRVLPDPAVRRWIRDTMKVGASMGSKAQTTAFGQRVLQHAQSILQIKRGCPCAEPWDVQNAIDQHRVRLTEMHARQYEDEERRQHIKRALIILVSELFRGKVFSEATVPLPSLHACFDNSAPKGGAMGDLMHAFIDQEWTADADFSSLQEPHLQRMYEVSPGIVKELRSDPVLERVHERFRLNCDVEACRYLNGQPANVRPCPVIEPCKVRMITLGPSGLYQMGLKIQRFLFGVLSRTSYFGWTGKPVSWDDWTEEFPVEEVMRRIREDDWVLVSGDYSAATDNLDPLFSETAWDAICHFVVDDDGERLLGSVVHRIGKLALTGHRLHYPHEGGGDDAYQQEWGQLMGSPVSFPILNLVNAAATAVGCGWRSGSVVTVLKKHMIHTNGDDVAFGLPRSEYEEWGFCTRAVGLEKSLGKNYTSQSFIIINSEMRCLTRAAGPTLSGEDLYQWRYVGFNNLALLFGIDAKGANAGSSIASRTAYFELGSLGRALCRECDEFTTANRMTVFCQRLDSVLRRCPAGIDYSVPEALGGLGLPLKRDVPQKARERCAWLACLDTLQRIQAVTPPTRRPIGPVERALRRAMGAGDTISRISDTRTFQSDDYLPQRLLLADKQAGGKGAILARTVARLYDVATYGFDRAWNPFMKRETEVEVRQFEDYFPTPDVKVDDQLVPGRPVKCSRDLLEEMERARREQEFTCRVIKQCKSAKAAVAAKSLTAMSLENVRIWADHRVVVETTIDVDVVDYYPRSDQRKVAAAAQAFELYPGLSFGWKFSTFARAVGLDL